MSTKDRAELVAQNGGLIRSLQRLLTPPGPKPEA